MSIPPPLTDPQHKTTDGAALLTNITEFTILPDYANVQPSATKSDGKVVYINSCSPVNVLCMHELPVLSAVTFP